MTTCPDETDLAGFVEGSLEGDSKSSLELHLDDCESCAQVVADLVRIYDDSAAHSGANSEQGLPTLEAGLSGPSLGDDEDEPERAALPAGAEVGRYRVLECIGFGGMGVVYSAYDPQLDRRIALKVLRTSTSSSGAGDVVKRNARLLREAKVMAKLSHPNVIVVHDVGSFDERVFLAMEFVDGTTLTRWMRSKEREWKDLREVFLAAGRGLAAAHEAGLVHRDFKPDNVLIGDDGRVRVTDFGLARFRDESIEQSVQGLLPNSADSLPREGLSSTFATLTKTGVLVGTPAYMAPEQYKGGGVTGATDQFAFCVALYEALYGERPFAGRSLAELATNVCLGRRRPLGDANVPNRIRNAVLKGLSLEPEQRFASMQALLAVLGRRPTRALRRWAVIAIPTAVAAGSLWWDAQPAEAGALLCRDESAVEGLWNDKHRERLSAAFDGASEDARLPAADAALDELDRYAVSWSAAREQLCDAHEGDAVDVVRGHCLLRARSRLAALLDVFDTAAADVVSGAPQAVQSLPDPTECTAEGMAVANLVPLPPLEVEAEVVDVRAELDRVRALSNAGQASEADEAMPAVAKRVRAIGYDPLTAEMLYIEGVIDAQQGRYRDSKQVLEDAALLGVECHHRRVAAEAWARLVFLETNVFVDFEAARRASRQAEAEIKALGNPPRPTNALRAHQAGLAVREGRLEEALTVYQELLESPFNEPPLRRADVLINLVNVYIEMASWDAALATAREYIEIYEEAFGQRHPYLVLGYYNFGFIYYAMDKPADALGPLQTSLEIGEAVLPPNHPDVAHSLSAMGNVLEELGRYDEALDAFERGRTMHIAGDLTPMQRAHIDIGVAEARVNAGKLEGGSALLDDAAEEVAELEPPDPAALGMLARVQAKLARARGDLPKAQARYEASIDAFRQTTANREYTVAQAQVELAKIAIAREDPGYARELLADVLQTEGADVEIFRAQARTLLESLIPAL